MKDATAETGVVTSSLPEPPPGVSELVKLYEGIEEVYMLAAAASGNYEQQSATTSSTGFRFKTK